MADSTVIAKRTVFSYQIMMYWFEVTIVLEVGRLDNYKIIIKVAFSAVLLHNRQ